jgi:hypothetical protein
MMDAFKDFVDIFVLVFLDDILIYSKTEKDHPRAASVGKAQGAQTIRTGTEV